MTVPCRCHELSLLWNAEADAYSDHLIRERVEEGGERVTYRCPAMRCLWIAEFGSDETGALSLLLKRLMPAAELVAFLAADPRPAVLMAFADPAIEFRPPDSDITFRGLEQAGRWAERTTVDPSFPRITALSMSEVGEEDVLVLGSLAYRRGDDFSEQRPAAWLVTVREGHLVRSLWFDSWEKARTMAGLPPEGGPPARRLGGIAWAELATGIIRPPRRSFAR